MKFLWFVNILAHHPFIILTGVSVFSCTCLVISFTLGTFPDFSDPREGFETRGTVLSKRVTAWKNLQESIRSSGFLVVNPKQFLEKQRSAARLKKRSIIKNETNSTIEPYIILYEDTRKESTRNEPSKWVKLHNLLNSKQSINRPRINMQNSNKDFFCGAPDEVYIRVVLESTKGSNLFTLDSLLALCRLENKLTQAQHYEGLCVQTFTKPRKCYKPWSLANYIARLHNRSSCLDILEEDVYNTEMLLRSCSQYFHNLELAPDCYENDHCKVPTRCVQYNAVYNILNFLTSVSFLPPNRTSDVILKQTMIFLPIAGSTATLPYYHVLEEAKLEVNGISVVGMDLRVKNFLFNEYLVRDTWSMSIGGLFIFLCIWLYTTSLFLTIMTIIAVIFSLGISYFMYTLVYELHFFPFMNLLAIIVVIGVSADDVFIFCKAWRISKKEKDRTTVQVMNNTFQYAFTSMIIRSVTTSAAYVASYSSTITTVRCFSVFAATAVLVNCLVMMWWLPACMVILENWTSNCPKLSKESSFDISKWKIWERFHSCKLKFLINLWKNREQILVEAVIRFRYFWLILLTTITILSGIVVLYYPKLHLPTTTEFQLFDKTHLFERYESLYKNMFWFSRTDKTFDPNMAANYKLPLRFVWGILPEDNGNYLNPELLGETVYDPSFDISREDSQKWLLKFCRKLRKQPFYQTSTGPLLPNCFIETFVSLMQRRCIDPVDNIDRTPCCETSQFPYNSSIFNTCIVPVMSEMFDTPSKYFVLGMAGPKFSKDDFPTIKAIVVEFDSSYDYSMSYKKMQEFVYNVEAWTAQQLKHAPLSMKNGWFVSDFEFYDLQNVLSEGTLAAIIVSMNLSLVVLMLATLNVVTSFYAILTISKSLFSIVAVLVLLGWQINVLESIAISGLTIGLTVDFSLHYIIFYGFCLNSENRRDSTRCALIIMNGPTFMTAVTTGAAGAFMMSSSILPYIRIGIFLLTVMSISWIYSTFFLCSLLAVAGPQNDFGQFQYDMLCCKKKPTSFKTRKARQNPSSSSLNVHELSVRYSKSGKSSSNKTLERSLSCGKNITTRSLNDQSSPAASEATIFIE